MYGVLTYEERAIDKEVTEKVGKKAEECQDLYYWITLSHFLLSTTNQFVVELRPLVFCHPL